MVATIALINAAAFVATTSTLFGTDLQGTAFDLGPDLRPLAEQYKLPGLVGAILHGDQIIGIGSTGVRKLGDPAAFLPTDTIHLGSDTKAMTAILIGQLIDQKQLTFDTTMAEIFPDLAPKMNPLMAKNTVRNLLNHNGGFPHDLDWWALNSTGLSLRAQRRLAVEKALSVPPPRPAGVEQGPAEFFVLIAPSAKVEDVRFISGAKHLRTLTEQNAKAEIMPIRRTSTPNPLD